MSRVAGHVVIGGSVTPPPALPSTTPSVPNPIGRN
jgi:hypothetical protein